MINNNVNRRPKKLWTQNNDGENILYYRANDERDEAIFAASTINECKLVGNILILLSFIGQMHNHVQ